MYHLLNLYNVPIFEQLQIEEALLRADTRNWCIINSGSPEAIVMGISGKPEKLLDLDLVKKRNIPVIKRFSGGGTVFIDEKTLFVTLISAQKEMYPKAILKWTETLYHPLFPGFEMRENDYVFGEKKFGGNAQYIQKDRWLHHTSFLWDFDPIKMAVLKMPEKRPKYRGLRAHEDFLCSLRSHFPKKESLIEAFSDHFKSSLNAKEVSFSEIEAILKKPHRKSTTFYKHEESKDDGLSFA